MYRKATISDIPECLKLGKNFIEYYGLKWNPECVKAALTALVDNGVFIVVEKNNSLIAMAAAQSIPNPWDWDSIIYQELFLWVEAEYRNSFIGVKLLKTLENYAPEDALVCMSVLPNSNLKIESLKKLGYDIKEIGLIKR